MWRTCSPSRGGNFPIIGRNEHRVMSKALILRTGLGVLLGGILVHCDGDSAGDEGFRRESGVENSAETHGRQLYLTSGCTLCHGQQGRGDGTLAEQYDPRPTDLTDPAALRGGGDVVALANVIRNGRRDNGRQTMPAYGHLSEKDRHSIARFIRSRWASDGRSEGE